MTEPIFAGKLSLTAETAGTSWDYAAPGQVIGDVREAVKEIEAAAARPRESWHGTQQFQPLPEQAANPAAARVRAEAARLGIDYDAEIAKILNRMKGGGMGGFAPGPHNKVPGPDPLRNVRPAEYGEATGWFKQFHGIT